jgi:HupE / UreJ protein
MLSIFKKAPILIAVFAMLIASQAFGHGMSEEEKQIIIEGGNMRYILIGATHMLTGYDHLLFVFGIIFFLTRFKDIVKYISAFTIGHSITLILATFNAIQVNYFLIDAVIALSVCYIAFHNLEWFEKYLNIKSPNMLAMIFSLGLIHGLGLSTRLQQLPLSEDQLLLNIISFNVGIEVGQIAALALMLLVIAAFRKNQSFPTFSKIVNNSLILAGALLFFMQMHGYEHTANAEELTANAKPIQKVEKPETAQQVEWKDTISINIPPRGEKEYKLQFEKGAKFQYAWNTNNGDLFFDFHGEPKGDTTNSFKSFKKGTDSRFDGSLTTLFDGTHGWYWKNSNSFPVTVTLKVSGDYQRLDKEVASQATSQIQEKKATEHATL